LALAAHAAAAGGEIPDVVRGVTEVALQDLSA
jgi:hypothetical protein